METSIPLWVVLVPILGAFALLIKKESDQFRNAIVIGSSTLSFILLLSLYSSVMKGSAHYAISWLPGFEITFNVDASGLLVALVTAFLWILCSVYSVTYMTHEKKRLRYDFFSLLTLATNLGVLVAGDFFTLFIFFEGLLIFPYPLIAHKEDAPAVKGANLYLYVGVATSLLLLSGMVLLKSYSGSLAIQSISPEVAASMSTAIKYQIAILMIVGFGGKAGLFFEHFWLPEAHPVAPTPASALLSAAMIKAGAYGIFRVVNLLFVPQGGSMTGDWLTLSNIGYWTIIIGSITMFFAVISALIATNSKRMLAFHSISQMGYIVMGIGCAAYLGQHGAVGAAGALYHIVNHALFKAALFLGVGAVYFRTNELDMYKLGGLMKNMPVTAICLFIAVCGISGVPFFNGFASKTILHHAIIESYEHGHDMTLWVVEKIFIVTAAGTFASNFKLFYLMFRGNRPKQYDDVAPAPLPMKIGMIGFSVAILFLGLFPNWLLETAIGPALAPLGFDSGADGYRLIYDVQTQISGLAILYPGTESFSMVLHNLFSGGIALVLGAGLLYGGLKYHWFNFRVPTFFTFDFYATKILRRLLNPWFLADGSRKRV